MRPEPHLQGNELRHESDDASIVRWMLGLTPEERLDVLQGFVDSVAALRNEDTAEV